MTVVLDTNVLVSGLICPRSLSGQIMRKWWDAGFDMVVSTQQMGEIARALGYPKIHSRLGWDPGCIKGFLRQLYLRCGVLEVSAEAAPEVPCDPADRPILATLLSSGVEYLVSGDSNLLDFSDGYPIVTPAEFMHRL